MLMLMSILIVIPFLFMCFRYRHCIAIKYLSCAKQMIIHALTRTLRDILNWLCWWFEFIHDVSVSHAPAEIYVWILCIRDCSDRWNLYEWLSLISYYHFIGSTLRTRIACDSWPIIYHGPWKWNAYVNGNIKGKIQILICSFLIHFARFFERNLNDTEERGKNSQKFKLNWFTKNHSFHTNAEELTKIRNNSNLFFVPWRKIHQ